MSSNFTLPERAKRNTAQDKQLRDMMRHFEIGQLEEITLAPGTKQCSDCQKTFTRSENLQRHLEIAHKKYWDRTQKKGRPSTGGKSAARARFYQKKNKNEKKTKNLKKKEHNRQYYVQHKRCNIEGHKVKQAVLALYELNINSREGDVNSLRGNLTVEGMNYFDRSNKLITDIQARLGYDDTFANRCIFMNYLLAQIERRVPGYLKLDYDKEKVLRGLAFGDEDSESFYYDLELEAVITSKLDRYFLDNCKDDNIVSERMQLMIWILHYITLVFGACENNANKINSCQAGWMGSLFNERSLQSIDIPYPYKNE